MYINIFKSYRIFIEVLSHTMAFIVEIAGFFLFSITEITQNNQPSLKPLQTILSATDGWTGISSVAVLAQIAPVTLSLAIPSIMSVQLIVEL